MEFTTHFELHSQTTRLVEDASWRIGTGAQTGFSPSVTPYSKGLEHQTDPENVSLNYNSERLRLPDFKFELFPLRSPLLGESLLVSFPPLTDMLKFSG